MASHAFGRLIAAGPLPFRGPQNILPPTIISAVEGMPVVYDVGEWTGFGLVEIEARVFSAGIALPDEGGMAIPGPEHATVYLVVTATDDSGVTVQLVSDPVEVVPLALFPVIVDPPVIATAAAGTLATATYGSATIGQIETTRWILGDDIISIDAAPVLPEGAAGVALTLEVVWENLGARTIAISAPKVIDPPPLNLLATLMLESGEDLLLEDGDNLLLEEEA